MKHTRRKVASVAFTGAAAAAAIGIHVPNAFATSGHWKISPFPKSGNFTAALVTGTNATLHDISSGGALAATLTCAKAPATGHLSHSTHTGTTAFQVGTTGAAFGSTTTPCVGLGGAHFTATLANTAQLWASTYNAGVTTGTIRNITATITGVGNSCHATIGLNTGHTGVPYKFHNTSHELTISPKSKSESLTIKTANAACSHIGVFSGDFANFAAKFKVSPAFTIVDP